MRFYRRMAGDPVPDLPDLPAGCDLRVWRPGSDGLPLRWPDRPSNLVWWAMQRWGLFSTGGFFEISISKGETLLHRLIVTPRWYRFPFMARGDLQLGDLWTAPHARGQGLARAAIGEVLGHLGPIAPPLWYVTAADNHASVGLIEGCGWRLVGTGRRTRPLGMAMLGQFVLDSAGGS